jgi:hypothetical protein
MVPMEEKLEFIGRYDPEGAERLKRLLERKEALKAGNIYGEKFTDRQFSLVFDPILGTTFVRARILELVYGGEGAIKGLSGKLNLTEHVVFGHIKELIKKNFIEIAGHEGRNAIFRKKQ